MDFDDFGLKLDLVSSNKRESRVTKNVSFDMMRSDLLLQKRGLKKGMDLKAGSGNGCGKWSSLV